MGESRSISSSPTLLAPLVSIVWCYGKSVQSYHAHPIINWRWLALLVKDLIQAHHDSRVLFIPGAMTATEVWPSTLQFSDEKHWGSLMLEITSQKIGPMFSWSWYGCEYCDKWDLLDHWMQVLNAYRWGAACVKVLNILLYLKCIWRCYFTICRYQLYAGYIIFTSFRSNFI